MYAATGMMPDEEIIEQTREAMGLNRPVLVQYVDWLWNCLHGDFGTSYAYGGPVSSLLLTRLWPDPEAVHIFHDFNACGVCAAWDDTGNS